MVQPRTALPAPREAPASGARLGVTSFDRFAAPPMGHFFSLLQRMYLETRSLQLWGGGAACVQRGSVPEAA
jgi:hypothetical protein